MWQTLAEALDGITSRAGLQWEIDDFAIMISPADPEAALEHHPKAR